MGKTLRQIDSNLDIFVGFGFVSTLQIFGTPPKTNMEPEHTRERKKKNIYKPPNFWGSSRSFSGV